MGEVNEIVLEERHLLGYNAVCQLRVNRRFRGTHRLHLRGRNIS
jgi:hypothetical protein